MEVLVESRRLAHLMVAFRQVGGAASGVGIKPGRQFEIAVFLMEIGGDRISPRDVGVDAGEGRQSCGGAVGLADCNGAVEPDDRSVGEPE